MTERSEFIKNLVSILNPWWEQQAELAGILSTRDYLKVYQLQPFAVYNLWSMFLVHFKIMILKQSDGLVTIELRCVALCMLMHTTRSDPLYHGSSPGAFKKNTCINK
jgi:hypothetical protein